jgi:hypothetical protein
VLLTANEQPEEIVPLETVHVVGLVIRPDGAFVSVTDVSEGLKPLPDTTTVTPGGPEVGLSVIAAGGTVKVAWAESRVLPVSTTVYVPGFSVLATVIEAEVIFPSDMLHESAEKCSVLLENEPELQ